MNNQWVDIKLDHYDTVIYFCELLSDVCFVDDLII